MMHPSENVVCLGQRLVNRFRRLETGRRRAEVVASRVSVRNRDGDYPATWFGEKGDRREM